MSVKSLDMAGVGGGVVRFGYLKKLKTYRKKFFVLRAETAESSARLEYYDSDRKFLNGQSPKRSIALKNCFNINRRLDTKYKNVIALYTKDDCFCVVLDSEEDLELWLKALLSLQHGEEVVDGETPKPTFEHVWQVTVLNRGLGTLGHTGNYRLCLTDKTLSLIKKDCEVPHIELNLSNIRSCGNLKDFFFLEVGRSCSLGAGELWMQTEDNNIAQNVHSTVYHAMRTNSNREDLGPKSRNRSSSATESSKPSTVGRKQIHAPKCHILSQDTLQTDDSQALPSSSSSQHPVVGGIVSLYQHIVQRGPAKTSERRHSLSAGGVSWSGNISHQRTQSLPLANPAPISDQNAQATSLRTTKRSSNQSSKCMAGGRERCDSMPSRARTTSEGNHNIQLWNQPRPHLLPYRPQSLYGRDISHSPPSGSPISPPSTDSAGSSYSLADDNEACTDLDPPLGRYSHSLTPDEAIAEEDCPDSPGMLYGISPNTGNYVPMAMHSSDDGYVDMSPRGRHHNNSPTASLSSVTSGTPSTDMRFTEYPLEKVISYFTPSEDDDARPARAYSVGSRPETYRYKKCMDLMNPDSRARAFSVGSKSKKMPGKVLPPHSYYAHPGVKSSSAPILSSRVLGSHNSIGPMDDLMEMDFSRSGSINNSGYMDMRSGSNTSNNSGYVEMKLGKSENSRGGQVTSPYVEMKSGSSPAKSHFVAPPPVETETPKDYYMDMDPKNKVNSNHVNHNNNNNTDDTGYIEMTFNKAKKQERDISSNYQISPARNSVSQGSPSNHFLEDESQRSAVSAEPRTPEGYVEMTIGRGHHQRQSSLDSAHISRDNDDYANISVAKKRERKLSKKERTTRSQPIAIQNPAGVNNQKAAPQENTGTSSSPMMYTILGRKFSTGTPPNMHLPLSSPYSSLPRQRTRKNSSRRDSKDSSSSSVTTPSSSSTIFPISLNSPCSPVKPVEAPVTIKVPSSVLNTVYKKEVSAPNKTTASKTDNSDYILMGGDNSKSTENCENNSDYVNYNPGSFVTPLRQFIMNRMTNLTLEETTPKSWFRPINETKDESQERIPDNLDTTELPDPAYEVLRTRPNSVANDKLTSQLPLTGESGRSSSSRPSSASSELCSSSGSTTIFGSRPASVNSDRIRPSSVVSSTDVQLHYASLDLDEGNRSPRTVKNQCSGGGACDNQGQMTEPGLTYAAIDFVKSEGLKHNALAPTTNKVKH